MKFAINAKIKQKKNFSKREKICVLWFELTTLSEKAKKEILPAHRRQHSGLAGFIPLS